MDHRWLEIVINARSEELDDLCGKLIANGVPGLAVEEEEEFRAFLEENRQYWDYVDDALMEQMKGVSRVKIYVTDDADGQAQLKGYLAGIDLPYTTVALREYDWAHSWQKYYRPMAVGEKLYIVPEWERDTADIPAGATRLLMNPGLTFGTGSHASTQLCLEGLEACTRKGDRVLDLGCGSGILAIAALCLGAGQAVGVDIDPKAVEMARENAQRAGVEDVVRFEVADAMAFDRQTERGLIVTNPPYGERIMEKQQAEALYRGFGAALRRCENWQLFLLSSHTEFERCFGRQSDKKRKLYNGMIKCDLFMYLNRK